MAGWDEELPRVINAMAPIRICDLGGWTDTWFAGTGTVLNVGVYPYAEVQIIVAHRASGEPRITMDVENYGDRYALTPGHIEYDRHPLLEACIDIMDLPETLSFEVSLYSSAPAGSSTGTSAAIAVAFIGALDLLTPGMLTPHQVASLAHRVETEKLGLQSGIQDQLASAYGGVCFIEMFRYPLASVSQLQLPNSIWWELERRLLLVYLGKAHSSSEVHGQVIKRLEGNAAACEAALAPLRQAAHTAKDALCFGDFGALGEAMTANTEAQAGLHPGLVSTDAQRVIELAREHGATGWKVNGAGGDGGSMSILCGADGRGKRRLIEAVESVGAGYRVIPTYLSRVGLRRWSGSA